MTRALLVVANACEYILEAHAVLSAASYNLAVSNVIIDIEKGS